MIVGMCLGGGKAKPGYRRDGKWHQAECCDRRKCAYRDHPIPNNHPLSKPPPGAHWYDPRGVMGCGRHDPGPASECDRCHEGECENCGEGPDGHVSEGGGLMCTAPRLEVVQDSEEPTVDLYRVDPSRPVDAVEAPAPAVEAVPETVPAAPVPELPPVRDVPPDVVQAATWLATWIWTSGAMARAQLAPSGVSAGAIDTYLNHAIDRHWLRFDGDQVCRGTVDPRPPEETQN